MQKAAGAIGTLYTGVLALAFSVSDRPLPPRGLVPAVLLGWAIVWATAYLAYLSKPRGVDQPEPTSDFAEGAMRRSITFIEWTTRGAWNRGYALQVSVVALAAALVFLPAPFISLDPTPPASAGDPAVRQPDWPKTPTAGPNLALEKIRFQAEVTEAAALRAKTTEPAPDKASEDVWWYLCGFAILLSLLLPVVIAGVAWLSGWVRRLLGPDSPGQSGGLGG